MGSNNLTIIGTGTPVEATGDLVDQYATAIGTDLVPRTASGVVTTAAGGLGTSSYKWANAYIDNILIDGNTVSATSGQVTLGNLNPVTIVSSVSAPTYTTAFTIENGASIGHPFMSIKSTGTGAGAAQTVAIGLDGNTASKPFIIAHGVEATDASSFSILISGGRVSAGEKFSVGYGASVSSISQGDVNIEGSYYVDGVQVVTNQQAAISDVPTGGSVDVQQNSSTINTILSRLRTHGLIDT